jgi:hypothetical protein
VISILVIGLVVGLVALAVIIRTPPDPGPRVHGEKIRLDTILDGKFRPTAFNATWFRGEKAAFFLSHMFVGLSCPLELALAPLTKLWTICWFHCTLWDNSFVRHMFLPSGNILQFHYTVRCTPSSRHRNIKYA